jgi:hypothetical protein
MSEKRLPTFFKILIWFYLILSAGALATALLDPSDDPLAAIFLVFVAMPWVLALDRVTEAAGIDSYWFNLSFACLGVLANAGVLYGLGRLFRKRSP